MPEQQRRPKSIKPWLALLLTLLVILVLFPHIAEPVAQAEQPGVLKTSMHEGQVLSQAQKRLLFQCGSGLAMSIILTFVSPLAGQYIPKIRTMWRLAKELDAAIKEAEITGSVLTEEQLTRKVVDEAIEIASQEPEVTQAAQNSPEAQNKLQQARDANSALHTEIWDTIKVFFQNNIVSNLTYACIFLFYVPYIDRESYRLFPDDPSTPATKELKPGEDVPTDASLESFGNPVDQLFSQPSDQLCTNLGTTYDAASDSCGGGDPAILAAYARLSHVVSDGVPADTGDLSPTPDASDPSNTPDQSNAS